MLCRESSRRLTAQQVWVGGISSFPWMNINELRNHSWVRDVLPLSSDPCKRDVQSCGVDLEQGRLSLSLMARSQDISFGIASSVNCEVQIPPLTCKSSFSSLLLGRSLAMEPGGFSFHSNAGSNILEFSTSVLALPSFAFFSSNSVVGKGNDALDLPTSPSRIDLIPRGGPNLKAVEDRKSISSGARILGVHSRRNHTIGRGEFGHFKLTVTESVIRWASRTNLPTTTSFRASLVC